jgi:hypothetical protein
MKRKTSTTPTRIWTYGLRWPRDPKDEAAVREQMLKAHRYQNVLIEIERTRRAEFRKARTECSPELDALEKRMKILTEAIETQRREIKSIRKVTRERTLHKSAAAALKVLQAERRLIGVSLKAARARVHESEALRTLAATLNEKSHARVREARAQSGLYWGTYLLVEKAMEAAARGKDDPRFRRFQGRGRVGVQIQKGSNGQNGMTVAELFGGQDTRLQVQPLPAGTWDTRPGRRHALTQLKIRIGSNGRDPIWATFDDLLQHRPLPADGVIKWAWIKLERIGTRTRWTFQLSLESESFAERKHKPTTDLTVAVNFGWRLKPDESLRVGYCVDEDGKERELVLPARLRQQLFHADKLRSANDLIFDEARKATVGEELQKLVENMHAWHDHARLVRVAMALTKAHSTPEECRTVWTNWKVDRFRALKDLYDSPEVVCEWLRAQGFEAPKVHTFYLLIWWKKNDHMWNMEARERDRALGWRKDLYRNYAAALARDYKQLLIEKFDLRDVAERPQAEDPTPHIQAAARARTHAAPSELRSDLLAAFHGEHLEQSADHNTLACQRCGTITDDAPAESIVITCPGCQSEHDQDRNNCQNQIARYRGEYRGPKPQAAE